MTILSLDLLGGKHYPKLVAEFGKDYGIGLFAEAFGDAYATAERALKNGCTLLRVQEIWHDSHSYGDKDIPKIKTLSAKYNKLALKYPCADIRLSVFCEHNVKNIDKYLDIAQEYAPNCKIVNTYWKGSASKKYINEIHGNASKPKGAYQYSYDGTEVTNSDVKKMLEKHKSAEVFFMWSSRFNLRYSEKDKTPRPQRIKEAKQRKPSRHYVESIAYLFSKKGAYKVPNKWIIKSHSERHDAEDRKADKLVILAPVKGSAVELKRDGKVVARLPYYGTYEGGLFRYYSRDFGYKYGANLDVFINGKKYGTINAGFRGGTFKS